MAFAEQEIYKAISANEFVPYFQPIVELRTGALEGFEILARWHHPTRGLIMPLDFIPFVERYGLMNKFTTCLLTQAFLAAKVIPRTICFSANISPSQLHDRALPTLLSRLAQDTSFDLRRLTAELTESALLDDLTLAGHVAADLKSLGMRLSLDDFGTGYSSLLHLQALPFDELKVDSSFVRTMVGSRDSRKITAAVISLGQSLGLRTVGEGVEERSQAELLTWQSCDLGQGWLYGRAVPADKIADIVAQGVLGGSPINNTISSGITRGLESHSTDRLSQLRAIYDGAPVGLCFLNCDLRCVNLNQHLADMNDLPLEAHLGRRAADLIPEAYPTIAPYLHRALAGEALHGIEASFKPRKAGNTPRTLLFSFQPVRDEAGELIGISVSVVDITAFKQNEEALRENAEHYKNTVELSPHMPWVADAAGKILSISSRWQALTGFTPGQPDAKGWLHPVESDDIEMARRQWKASIRTGHPLDIEFTIRDVHGNRRWMRSRAMPHRDADGVIVRWYGSNECIDDQKQALETLAESESTLRSVFESAPTGLIFVESATGTVAKANPRAQSIMGVDLPIGFKWDSFSGKVFNMAGKLMPAADLPLARALRLGECSEAMELRICRPDGTAILVSATANPVRSEQGGIVGCLIALTDIDAVQREWIGRLSQHLPRVHRVPKPIRAA